MVRSRQFSRIDELVRLAHPKDGHPKVLAMIDAYLDESGIHKGAKVCMVAGYFGGPGQMKRFDKAWRQTLGQFNFPMENFHAKDLLKRRDAWPMLLALSKVAGNQAKVYPVAFGIVVDDFNSFSLDERRFMTGARLMNGSAKLVTTGCPSKPYFVPFQWALKIVTDHAPVGGLAHFYFGLGEELAEYALAMFRQIKDEAPIKQAFSSWKSRDRLGDPSFPLAKNTAPLQAADLLVHTVYQYMVKGIESGVTGDFAEDPSEIALNCVANVQDPHHLVYQNKKALQKVIDDAKALVPRWNPRP